MHLDTVCTMVDVDAVVMYPNVASTLHGRHTVDRRRRTASRAVVIGAREPFLVGGRQGDGHRHAADHRHRPRPGDRRARAVGRRQQHPGARARGSASRYERNVETNAQLERAGIEVIRDPRLRAGLRPGRPAMHVLPDPRAPICAWPRGWTRPFRRVRRQRRVSWRPIRPCLARRSAASSGSLTASASAYRLANSATGASHSSPRRRPAGPRRDEQAVRAEHAGELGVVAEQQPAAAPTAGTARPAPGPRRRRAPSARGPCPVTRHQYAAGAAASRTVG